MQKIFDKKLKTEIQSALKSVNFDNVGGINKSLDNPSITFLNKI